MRRKDNIKNIHIGGDIWKYVVDRASNDWNGEIRIYDNNRKMYRVPTKEMIKFLGNLYSDGLANPHTLSSIQMYIETNLYKCHE